MLALVVLMMLLDEFHISPAGCHPTSNGYKLAKQLKTMATKANQQKLMKYEAALGLQQEVNSNINTLFGLL